MCLASVWLQSVMDMQRNGFRAANSNCLREMDSAVMGTPLLARNPDKNCSIRAAWPECGCGLALGADQSSHGSVI